MRELSEEWTHSIGTIALNLFDNLSAYNFVL